MVSFPPRPSGRDSLPVYSRLTTDADLPSLPTKQPLYKRSPALFAAGGLALVAFTALLVAAGGGRRLADSSHPATPGNAWTAAHPAQVNKNSKKVCDPHDLPGVLHIADSIDSIQGALQTEWKPINASACPPQSYIQRIASGDSSASIPSALYNRTILLIGDSIDRANAQYTCHLLKGSYTITNPGDRYWPQDDISNDPNITGWKPNEYSARSFPTICHVGSIDLMIMNVFHFGLDQEDYFTWKDQYGPPYDTEDRVLEIAKPLADKVGRRIDILEFSSGLWDLARFGRQDDSLLNAESTTTVRHLTLERLQWFSSRFSTLLTTLSTAFPPSTISQRYVRLLHTSSDDDAGSFQQWWQVGGGGSDGAKHTYYFPSWRVHELNNAIISAVGDSMDTNTVGSENAATWELDHWGDKLAGMELFDKGNVHPHYAATTLWLEQMFYRLVNE